MLVGRPGAVAAFVLRRSGWGPRADGTPQAAPSSCANSARNGTDRVLIAEPGHEALGRPVHDLPVAQVATAAERNRAGADAADGQRDTVQVRLVEHAQRRPGLVVEHEPLARVALRGLGVARGETAEGSQPAQAEADRLHEVAPIHLWTAVLALTATGLGL